MHRVYVKAHPLCRVRPSLCCVAACACVRAGVDCMHIWPDHLLYRGELSGCDSLARARTAVFCTPIAQSRPLCVRSRLRACVRIVTVARAQADRTHACVCARCGCWECMRRRCVRVREHSARQHSVCTRERVPLGLLADAHVYAWCLNMRAAWNWRVRPCRA